MAMKKKAEKGSENVLEIESVETHTIDVCLLGTSPLVMNRLSQKARFELLMPAPPKNKAEKAMRLKHIPINEYRDSVYRTKGDSEPTRLVMPAEAFRRGIASAALDLPGSTKAQIGRLCKVPGYNVSIWGTPQIFCAIVRQAGINRTPDVRTRAIVPNWCCQISIKFAYPILQEKQVVTLLAAAGEFIGVGDGRNEKGALSFGSFMIVDRDNPHYKALLKQGRLVQDKALEDPVPFDLETEDLLTWFGEELVRRRGAATSTKRAVADRNGEEAAEEVGVED